MALTYYSESFAQQPKTTNPNDNSVITLNDNTNKVEIGKYAFIYHDSHGRLILPDIIKKFKNNEITLRSNQDKIFLKYNTAPTWLIFNIDNRSSIPKWYLDMGSIKNGRSGVIQKFLLYDVTKSEILYNGLKKGATNDTPFIGGRYFPLEIDSSQKTLLLYILPTNHKRIAIEPLLKRDISAVPLQISDIAFDYLHITAITSTLFLIIGFFVVKNSAFIALITYYFLISIWLIFIEKPFLNSVIGIETITLSFPVLMAFLIGLTSFLSTVDLHKKSWLKTFLTTLLGLCLVVLLLFIILYDDNHEKIKLIAAQLISLSTVFVAFLYSARQKNNVKHGFRYPFLLWILLYLCGQIITLAAVMLYIPYNQFFAHADYLILYPQAIIIFFGVINSIKHNHNHKMDSFIRQMQKAQSILKAKKSKEEYDNTKLLRVIEREREVMEELRARETERTEEMRQSKIAADEANQAKSAFLAVVSHEIRTPMTGVLGMLRMLQDTDLTSTQEDYVTTIKESSDAMVALLNDILDFSKIEDGKLNVEKIEFDLHRVLNGIIMLMKGHADQKGVELKLNIDNAVPSLLRGDPTRLRQVILNLLGNALKFTLKGSVTINVYVDPTHPAHKNKNLCPVYFSIEDTGIGISEEAQHHLFNPFEQADESISRKYGGTGLGLAICKKLIEAMGGQINLKSKEGSGTSFFFTLAFSRVHRDHDEVSSDPTSSTHTETVQSHEDPYDNSDIPTDYTHEIPDETSLRFLIIDDNEINRKVVKAFLDKESYDSVMTYSGKEALDLLQFDKSFDAIFLDIEMPEINGKDVAKIILADETLKNIPIIALTGNVGSDNLREYHEIGFRGCIGKPVTPEKLLKITGNILFGDGMKTGLELPLNLDQDVSSEKNKTSSAVKKEENDSTDDTQSVKSNPIKKTSKTLDEAMVKGLKDGLGTAQTIDMLKDLFVKADEIISSLKKAVRDENREATRVKAHELKGMCSNFGLKAVSEKSREIELLSMDEERILDDIEPHLTDLQMLIERSKLALNDFFND